MVIDGGFSKAYQSRRPASAGYTLIYNSYGLVLAAHEPFTSMEDTVLNEIWHPFLLCRHGTECVVNGKTVTDTDVGKVSCGSNGAGTGKNCCRRIEVVCWWRSSWKTEWHEILRKRNPADFIFILELLSLLC
ncbi:MAG: fructose-bisphosphatase class III [Eubacterium ramulus]